MEDIISVIVPIYKAEEYLSKCIESILNQTYKNLEIILVDDGSPDKCGEICDKYMSVDSRIKVIHKKNGGLSSARNDGMDIATGKYIAFIDSDDYIDKDMYKSMIAKLKEENADIVQCGYKLIDGHTDNIIGRSSTQAIMTGTEATEKFMSSKIMGYVWNRIYKRCIFQDNNIRYPDVFCYEDMIVTLLCLMNCKKLIIINECRYNYRKIKSSISRKRDRNHIKAFINQNIELINVIKEENNDKLNAQLNTFNIIVYINALGMYIQILNYDRNLIYKDYKTYFNEIEPDISIMKCIEIKELSRGFKFIYILNKLKIYDLFLKFLNKILI